MATAPVEPRGVLPRKIRPHLCQLREIDDAVGIGSDTEMRAVRNGGRGIRNQQRAAAVLLATEHGDARPEHVAERYGYASIGSLRSAVSRARRSVDESEAFGDLVAVARARLARRDAA